MEQAVPRNQELSPNDLDLIRRNELARRLQVSTWSLMRWAAQGKFPKPLRLGDNIVAWRVADVEAWLEKQRVKS
jgi:prophage regulatory protein